MRQQAAVGLRKSAFVCGEKEGSRFTVQSSRLLIDSSLGRRPVASAGLTIDKRLV
jgi:hypothetical protein